MFQIVSHGIKWNQMETIRNNFDNPNLEQNTLWGQLRGPQGVVWKVLLIEIISNLFHALFASRLPRISGSIVVEY